MDSRERAGAMGVVLRGGCGAVKCLYVKDSYREPLRIECACRDFIAEALDAHAAERVREALERAAEIATPMCLGKCGLPTCTGDRIRALLKKVTSNG